MDTAGQKAAWNVEEYVKEADICKVHFYKLIREGLGPRSVKLGKRRRIIESQRDWLIRIAASQEKKAA